jgi:DNA-binding NarL/FixJ family response regulator
MVSVVKSPTTTGHADKVRELLDAWTHVTQMRPNRSNGIPISRTAVITGPAASGKSRVVATVLEALSPHPASIHAGTARVHSPAPYDWLAAILSQHDRLDAPVPRAALGWLRQDPDVPPDRYAPDALLRIAVRVVRALVSHGPAILVVEDLHALDPASLNLIAELAVAPALPALLLVTSRPTDAPLHAATLARLAGAQGAIRHHLDPRHLDSHSDSAHVDVGHVDPQHLGVMDQAGVAAAGLTARELDVLACLAEGMSNQQVATRLGISVRTVGVHVSNLLRKTRSRSRTDAALWAWRHRLARTPA